MKKRWQWPKLVAHPSVLMYFGMYLAVGWFKESIIAFFIILWHEYSHGLVACLFGYEIKEIRLYPFGAFLMVRDFGLKPIWQDLLLVLAGPLSHLGLYLFGLFLRPWLGTHSYAYYTLVNQSVLILNLLPIWPLDGAKLLLLCLSFKLDYLLCMKLLIPISLLTLGLFAWYTFQIGHILIYAYLLTQIWDYASHFYYYYLNWLIGRLAGCRYRRSVLHHDRCLLRPYHNFYLEKGCLMDEKSFIQAKFLVDK